MIRIIEDDQFLNELINVRDFWDKIVNKAYAWRKIDQEYISVVIEDMHDFFVDSQNELNEIVDDYRHDGNKQAVIKAIKDFREKLIFMEKHMFENDHSRLDYWIGTYINEKESADELKFAHNLIDDIKEDVVDFRRIVIDSFLI